MFMRMERIEQECDELKIKLQKYETRRGNEMKEIRDENSLNVIKNIKNDFGLEVENKTETNKIIFTPNKKEIVEAPSNTRPSALV